MKILLSYFFFGIVLSCSSVKKDIPADHIKGTIVYSTAENDCSYTIKVTNDQNEVVFYDPINLEDDLNENNLEVAFKFRPLKMKNRCDKANPISIITIMKR